MAEVLKVASAWRVAAVVVTYHPDPGSLATLLERLKEESDWVVLVDNGSDGLVGSMVNGEPGGNLKLQTMPSNVGIAAAQNAGIAIAKALSARHVAFFDQDSLPDVGMVAKLCGELARLRDRGAKVACVGPRYIDRRHPGPPPFIRIEGFSLVRCACNSPDDLLAVDYLVSSGSVVAIETLDAVGGLEEDLFIDYVDIEWGLRAKAKGYQSYGVCAATMQHSLGEEPLSVFGFKAPVHSALRHYYLFRNSVWMWKQAWIPWNWKVVDGYRLILKLGFYMLFAKPRLAHLRMMLTGLSHGVRGRMGRLDE